MIASSGGHAETVRRLKNEVRELKAANQVLENKLLAERAALCNGRDTRSGAQNFMSGLLQNLSTFPHANGDTMTLQRDVKNKLQWYELREEERQRARRRLCRSSTSSLYIEGMLLPQTDSILPLEEDVDSVIKVDDIIKVDDSETEFSKQSQTSHRSPKFIANEKSSEAASKSVHFQRRRSRYRSIAAVRRCKSVDLEETTTATQESSESGDAPQEHNFPKSCPPAQDLTQVAHLEAVLKARDERIKELEETIHKLNYNIRRLQQQVLQLSETMTDFRNEIDGSDAGSLAKQVNVLESRLSFAMKRERDLEAELGETVKQLDRIYQLEAAIKLVKVSNKQFCQEIEEYKYEVESLRQVSARLQYVLIHLDGATRGKPRPSLIEKAVSTTPESIDIYSGSTSPHSPSAERFSEAPGEIMTPRSAFVVTGSMALSVGLKRHANWALQRKTLYMLLKKEKRMRCNAERKLADLLSTHLETLEKERIRRGSQESLVDTPTNSSSKKGRKEAVVNFAGAQIFDFT